MYDRTDHVLAAIDGALDWAPGDGDAMRWTPEPPQTVEPREPRTLTVTPEQFQTLTQGLAPLAAAANEFVVQLREAFETMARTLAESPE